ncbi:hypothetical protein L6R52_19650 [Myxococcota bacterium]|nr:hypothetical protein [Myxococcota bacterium]
MDRDDREALVEITTERAGLDQRAQVAVRRGDDAEVDAARLELTEPRDDAVFEHAQQLHLCVERRVVDLVEEHRAALGRGEPAVEARDGAGERAARVAEELGLHQLVRDRGAVDRHEPRAVAPRPRVDEARRDLFARAGLTGDEHGLRRARGARDLCTHAPTLGAVADEDALGRRGLERRRRRRELEGPADDELVRAGLARVDDVVRARAHGDDARRVIDGCDPDPSPRVGAPRDHGLAAPVRRQRRHPAEHRRCVAVADDLEPGPREALRDRTAEGAAPPEQSSHDVLEHVSRRK